MEYLILSLLIAIVVFIITREFWCWYFKINERRDLLKEQNDLLKNLINLKDGHQAGFTGPDANMSSRQDQTVAQGQTVTVSQVKGISGYQLVMLTGNIIQSLGKDKHIFRDSTGDITIKIDRKKFTNLSVGENDMVEINGEVGAVWETREKGVIVVKNIRKL